MRLGETLSTVTLEAVDLPEAFDRQGVRGDEGLLLAVEFFVRLVEVLLVADRGAAAILEDDEVERCRWMEPPSDESGAKRFQESASAPTCLSLEQSARPVAGSMRVAL